MSANNVAPWEQTPPPAAANIERRYAIENASWIWHPALAAQEVAHLMFCCRFALPEARAIRLHVTADQRYELQLDGRLVSRGPDRSDVFHWSFASYEIELPAGDHVAEALVWWEGRAAPLAQTTLRGGFLCAAEGFEDALNTGRAPWQVARLGGISFRPPLRGHFHAVGPGYDIDTAAWSAASRDTVPAAVIEKNWHHYPNWWHWGTVQPDWALHPSPLPDQMAEFRRAACVRAIQHGDCPERHRWREIADGAPALAEWTGLLGKDRPLVLPRHSRQHVLLDLGDYVCGYPVIEVSGGAGTRVELLCTYVMSADRRLARRAIELFDWSRWRTGFIAQRYPSDPFQLSLTFSMLWVGMVRDFAWWADDPDFVRQRLVGVRGVTEQLLALRNESGLLARLPGWSFVDWVDGWCNGVPPGECEAGSASVNLQFLGLLRDAADLEQAFGVPRLAMRCRDLAAELAAAIRRVFWDAERQMFAETATHAVFTQHAQVLAILGRLVAGGDAARLLAQAQQVPGLARCSLYFTHYLFESAQRCGDAGVFAGQLSRWHALREAGYVTTPESEDSPRSNCHGWSAHPLFHLRTTVAGVRPAAPGFARVTVNPLPGSLGRIDADVPHPRGQVVVRLTISEGELAGGIELPPQTEGELGWADRRIPLVAGRNVIATGSDQPAHPIEGGSPLKPDLSAGAVTPRKPN